jgi:CcmD family protein
MNGNSYLFAAYAVTWIIHIAYISTIVSRYSRLKREIAELKKPGVRSQVSGPSSQAKVKAGFIANVFPET